MRRSYDFAVEWTSCTLSPGRISIREPHRSLTCVKSLRLSKSTKCSSVFMDAAPWISCHFKGRLATTIHPRSRWAVSRSPSFGFWYMRVTILEYLFRIRAVTWEDKKLAITYAWSNPFGNVPARRICVFCWILSACDERRNFLIFPLLYTKTGPSNFQQQKDRNTKPLRPRESNWPSSTAAKQEMSRVTLAFSNYTSNCAGSATTGRTKNGSHKCLALKTLKLRSSFCGKGATLNALTVKIAVTGLNHLQDNFSADLTPCGHLLCFECVPRYRQALKNDNRRGSLQCPLCPHKIPTNHLTNDRSSPGTHKSSAASTDAYFKDSGMSSKVLALVNDIKQSQAEGKRYVLFIYFNFCKDWKEYGCSH